jgi:FkbM family methyltransferase
VNAALRRLLTHPAANWVVTRPLRVFARFIPRTVTDRLPVCGTFSARTSTGTRFHFTGLPDDTIAHAVYWQGIAGWEPETVRVVETLARDSVCFFDVGANSGLLTVIAARSNPDLVVHSFEPVPAVYEALVRNLAANRLTRVAPHQLALTDRTGAVALHVPPGDVPTEASIVRELRSETTPLTVRTMTVDDFRSEHPMHCIDLMKIDTEATEHLVLAGAKATLARDHPTIICEVLHGQVAETHLPGIIEREGYDCYQITERGIEHRSALTGDPGYRFLNFLFVHPSRSAFLSPGLQR